MSFEWINGRTLSQIVLNDGDGVISNVVNSDGIRINKDVMWFDGSASSVNYAYEYNTRGRFLCVDEKE